MVRQIDDIVSFDPAESYEFTNNEVDGNCYRRLVRPDLPTPPRWPATLPKATTSAPTV